MNIKASFVSIGRTIRVIATITVKKSYGPVLSAIAGMSIGLLIWPNWEQFFPRLIVALLIWLIIVFHALFQYVNNPSEIGKL